MNIGKLALLAALGSVPMLSFSENALGEITPTSYGWTRVLETEVGKEFVVAYTNTADSHTFTVPPGVDRISYLIVGGGGGGGCGLGAGGGGAGGLIAKTNVVVSAGTALTIHVGEGGNGGDHSVTSPDASCRWDGLTGSDSSVTGLANDEIAYGGGGGGGEKDYTVAVQSGKGGGSGGGGAYIMNRSGGSCVEGQGHKGGSSYTGTNYRGGGGGGAGGEGTAGGSGSNYLVPGGAGLQSAITGELKTYAEGGVGNGYWNKAGANVAAKTTIGSGGNSCYSISGRKGNDGIVVIRYAYLTQVAITAEGSKSKVTAMCAGKAVADGDKIARGSEVVVVSAPYMGYEYTAAATPADWEKTGEEGAITKTFTASEASLEIVVPEPEQTGEVVTLVTVSVTPAANATYTAKSDGVGVGDKAPTNAVIAVVATAAAYFEYASVPEGWFAGENGTVTNAVIASNDPTEIVIPTPTRASVEVAVTTAEHASCRLFVGEVEIPALTKLDAGTDVTAVVTPDQYYEFKTEPEGWTRNADGTLTRVYTVDKDAATIVVPDSATKIQITLKLTGSGVTYTAVKEGTEESVKSGDVLDADIHVTVVVTARPDYAFVGEIPEGWTNIGEALTGTFLAGTIVLPSAKFAPADGELIENGGFEKFDESEYKTLQGFPTSMEGRWAGASQGTSWAHYKNHGLWKQDSVNKVYGGWYIQGAPYDGKYAAGVTGYPTGPFVECSFEVAVAGSYDLSYYAKSIRPQGDTTLIVELVSNNSFVRSLETYATTSSWVRREVNNISLKVGTYKLRFRGNNANSSCAGFDNVSLKPRPIKMVTVTLDADAYTDCAATTNGAPVEIVDGVATVVSNEVLTVFATPKAGYEYVFRPTGWTKNADGTYAKKFEADKTEQAISVPTVTAVPALTGLHFFTVTPKAEADPNGRDSGVIELKNYGPDAVNLSSYKIVRSNYGKAVKASGAKSVRPLLDRVIGPGEVTKVYMSEEYPTAKDFGGDDITVKNFGKAGGKVVEGGDNAIMVVPNKINPKKYPRVQLYTADGRTVLDDVVVPCEIDDGIFVRVADTPTGLVRYVVQPDDESKHAEYGPEVNGLYGVADAKGDLKLLNKRKAFVPTNKAFKVEFPINPFGIGGSVYTANEIQSVSLEYRFFDATATRSADMPSTTVPTTRSETDDPMYGAMWTASIPAEELADKAGRLVQYRARIVTKDGKSWTAPRFVHPELGYEWYGAVVDPGESVRTADIPTFLMFGYGAHLTEMDKDAVAQDMSKVPYNARVAVYDTTTHTYYDNVRIDLRGNTTASFNKKSHGFRFSKVAPLKTANPLDGEEYEVRKTSFIAEATDPTMIRQALSFYVFSKAGCRVPFDYPVRVYLNGSFYQLAFHSVRFTDEYVEDFAGLNKYGYSYKSIGPFVGFEATEKKTPDDDNEADLTVLKAYQSKICDGIYVGGAWKPAAADASAAERVTRYYDLPAWINYLAASRITQEMDGEGSNLSGYINTYDEFFNPDGNDLFMPLAYDLNMSWGVWWCENTARTGLNATDDVRRGSHPLNGGPIYGIGAKENRAVSILYHTEKYRRLMLRRLRTLMDAMLKAPGTAQEDTPIWRDYVQPYRAMLTANPQDEIDDHTKWNYNYDYLTETGRHNEHFLMVWPTLLGLTADSTDSKGKKIGDGYADLWENYIVPRRQHLFGTHSVTNGAFVSGYAADKNASIPESQSPVEQLRQVVTVEAIDGGVVIRNTSGETIDLSGWKITGPVEGTIPEGTVLDWQIGDQPGEVFLVTDRRAYIKGLATVGSQVIVGNMPAGTSEEMTLSTDKGRKVFPNTPRFTITIH